jgi:hypothetical protein
MWILRETVCLIQTRKQWMVCVGLDVWDVLKFLLLYDHFCRENCKYQHCFAETMGPLELFWPDVCNFYSSMSQSITRRTSSLKTLLCNPSEP